MTSTDNLRQLDSTRALLGVLRNATGEENTVPLGLAVTITVHGAAQVHALLDEDWRCVFELRMRDERHFRFGVEQPHVEDVSIVRYSPGPWEDALDALELRLIARTTAVWRGGARNMPIGVREKADLLKATRYLNGRTKVLLASFGSSPEGM